MASSNTKTTEKSMCGACAPKQAVAITSCKGCLGDFCRKHFNEHRDKLFKELHGVFDRHDTLLQELQLKIDRASKSLDDTNAQALLKQIDEWKMKTIQNISQAAEEVRANVERLFSRRLENDQLKQRIDKITNDLKEQQESESFVETDIDQWMKQLEQLKIDLNRPSAIEINPPTLLIQNVDWHTIINIHALEQKREKSSHFDGEQFATAKKYEEVSHCNQAPQTQLRPKNLSYGASENTGGATARRRVISAKKDKGNERNQYATGEGDEMADVYTNKQESEELFARMPKPSFNMNEFKRVYSNEDTLTKAIPYFWKNFDKEKCSIWFCEYKYPEDLTQVFMTCNLVSGFFQRLDQLRKHAFASMCVFGENNNNAIAGVWLWHGHELVFEFSSDWQRDYESYSWKRLSADDEDTKKLVNQYFLWEVDHNDLSITSKSSSFSMQKTADNSRSSNAAISMDNQEKLLADALQNVRQHAFSMKRVLDQQSVMEGLKHAANMLGELRTSLLSPKNYYELHVVVVEELHHLELYLTDEFEHGRGSHDLYEVVQYAGNIVPRLYLLITIGHVYIRANELPRREVLRDLVEMCRGVQHPLRGLFLRNYLLQCAKSLLPDTEEENQEDNKTGTILDSLDFILLNFSEMNKLWVRMQYQGHTRDLQRREQERRELRILVGTNLVRLSELECVNVERYKTIVLPKIMEQVVSCRDPIAQEYLMECIIQVFPDEYHLNTLNEFLKGCRDLAANVNIRNILISLIDRLTSYSTRDGTQQNIPENIQLFDIFSEQIAEVVKSRSNMPSEDIVALQSALLSLSLKCYRDQYEYGNKVLENTRKIFDDIALDTQVQTGTQAAKELVKMLKIPIDCYDILDVLKLNHYKLVLQLLSYRERHIVCMYIINGILDKETIIPTAEQVTQLFDLLVTLLVDQADSSLETSRQSLTNEDFVEEQNLVARLCNNLKAPNDPDQQYHIIKICQDTFKNGGLERMRFTYPPIIMQAYALTFRYKDIREQDEKWEKKCQKLFQLCNQLINTLTKLETHDLPLRLYLQGALAASEISSENTETIAYEFFSQAYTIYEEQGGDTRAQCASLTLLIGTLEKVSCFGEENHSTLRQSLTQAATRLVKRPDQVRTLLLCTHLFWSAKRTNDTTQKPEQVHDGEKVLACLKKATKLTTQVMDQSAQIQLYNELLNTYLYFFNQNHPDIDITAINSLIEKLQGEMSKLDTTTPTTKTSSNDSDEFIRNQIQKTFEYLRQQSQVEKFQGLQINN